MVDVEFVARLPQMVTLPDVKAEAKLAEMELIKYGRLSVQGVKKAEFQLVKKMGGLK